MRIIDVAIKYGYNSADSFSCAFHFMHGILPSEARSANTQLKAYPRNRLWSWPISEDLSEASEAVHQYVPVSVHCHEIG